MKLASFRLPLALVIICSACAAADQAPKKEAERPRRPAPREARPATDSPSEQPSIDRDGVIVKDGVTEAQPVIPVPVGPAADENADKPKDPEATAEAAREAEKLRVADEAAAFARGEGERYARRQKAYEDARSGASRVPPVPTKKSSIAQLEMPDGRCVVIAGGDRIVFANKAAADAYVAKLRQAELERPIVLDGRPAK